MKQLFIVFIAVLYYSCASSQYSSGTYFDQSMVDKIAADTTTVADVENIFGKPGTISMDGENLIYNYIFTQSKSEAQSYVFTMDYKVEGFQRMLSIIFDKNNVVKRFNFSETPLNLNSN